MRFFLVVILSGLGFSSFGQSQVDSLQRLIDREGDTKHKVELLNELSFSLFGFDVERSGSSTQLALRLSQQIGDKQGEGWATAYRGIYFLFSGSLENAHKSFERSLQLAQELQDNNLQVYSLMQLGNVDRDKGVFDSAHYFYQEAERIAQLQTDPFYQSVVKMNKGRYYLILNKPDSALYEIEQARRLRESLHDPTMMTDVYLLLGNCYREKYDFKKAEAYYAEVLRAAPPQSTLYAQYLLNMGEVFFSQGDFIKALENWSQVLAFHRKLNYKYELASLLYRMGEVFEEQGYYDLAVEYLSNSLRLSEKVGYQYLSAEVYYELAWVFYRNNNLEQATYNIKKSETLFDQMNQELRLAGCLNVKGLIQLKKNNYDSSLYFHQSSLRERERIGDKVAISSSLYNLGELFNKRKEFSKALSHLWKGVRIDESIGDKYGMSLYYYQLGKTYNLLGGLDSARYYLDKAVGLAIPTSATDVLRNSYGEMADYLQRTKKYEEAISYYKRFNQLTDSIFNKQSSQSLASFRTLYDVEKKEREIELLNKDNLIAREQSRRQRLYFYVAIGGLFVLVGMAVFYYRFANQQKKLNQEITEKSEEIQTQSEELSEANAILSNLNKELETTNTNLKLTLDDLHKTQGQLVQSEKMASLGLLSSGVAHEINNPLNFIKGGVNALSDQLQQLDENKLREVKPYVDIINEGVNRASTILKGLSHFSRQNDRHNETCDLHGIIDNCLLMLNNKLKHRITVDRRYAQVPAVIMGNEGKLHQAFLNILSNAEQAIAEKGVIRIETNVSNDSIKVIIADTGCGISQENLSKVKDPFFTTKPPGQGTGLGLSITYTILEDHQGKISITSEVNKGTEFLVLFSPNKT